MGGYNSTESSTDDSTYSGYTYTSLSGRNGYSSQDDSSYAAQSHDEYQLASNAALTPGGVVAYYNQSEAYNGTYSSGDDQTQSWAIASTVPGDPSYSNDTTTDNTSMLETYSGSALHVQSYDQPQNTWSTLDYHDQASSSAGGGRTRRAAARTRTGTAQAPRTRKSADLRQLLRDGRTGHGLGHVGDRRPGRFARVRCLLVDRRGPLR